MSKVINGQSFGGTSVQFVIRYEMGCTDETYQKKIPFLSFPFQKFKEESMVYLIGASHLVFKKLSAL